MEPRINMKRVTTAGLIILILISSWFGFRYMTSFETITITYKNIEKAEIYNTPDSHNSKHGTPVSNINQSGQKIKLKKGSDYIIDFTGSTGYENGTIILRDGQKEIYIDPYLSEEKLEEIRTKELPIIHAVITNKYPNINLYTLGEGRLYQWGEWYGTTLKYIGTDSFNSDTLRLILKKENNTWVIKTDPPNITLNKFMYGEIPEEILRDVNNFLE